MASKRTQSQSTSKSNECSNFIDQTIHEIFSPEKTKKHNVDHHPLCNKDCCGDCRTDFDGTTIHPATKIVVVIVGPILPMKIIL